MAKNQSVLLTSLVQNRVDGAVEELRHHGHTALEGDDVLRLCCGRHVGCWVVSSAVRALASSLAGKMLALLAACERKRSRLYVRTLRHKKGRPRSPAGVETSSPCLTVVTHTARQDALPNGARYQGRCRLDRQEGVLGPLHGRR